MTTTATIEQGIRLTGGHVWTMTVHVDQKPASRGGLTKGRKVGSLVADTLPELLDAAARLAEQEGDLDGIAAAITKAKAS